ncbi:MAG: hypothetical protein JXB50_03040, partial [Spirochaetes bacterium]|nr:hypothetical protein [Spirochaetota bacterium]
MFNNLINLISDDNKKTNNKIEFLAPVVLIIIILIFLMPMFLQIEGINVDDAAFASFPKLMAVARSYQYGELPLWDFHEFSGGKPFYIMLENPAYNIFHLPFYYMANLDDIDQSFYVLYIIPFSLMVIFAGLGAYMFARFYFKFNYLISILMGFLWAVNPSIGNSVLSTMDTMVFACMPWIVFAMAQFFETKKWYWWITGVFSFALLNTSYTVNYPVRIYFTIACMFLILSIWYIIKDLKNIIVTLLALLIPITAFFVTAFVWAHILESAKYSTEQVKLSYSEIVNFIPNSVPPGHLLTLFIPNFNGSLNNIHAWGDGLLIHSADRNLTGGIFTTFCILISIIVLYYNKDWKININKKQKIWLIISLAINVLMLSVMMARYTPVYFILCKIIPWIFLIPHPFYFHFAHHFA